MPSPEEGAGPIPERSGRMYWLPDGTPSPESGAGPGLIGSSVSEHTAFTQSTAIVNIATMAKILISFFISITTCDKCKRKYKRDT